MSIDATYSKSLSALGTTYAEQSTVSSALATPWSVSLAAAKTGTLTTRTNNTDGTLTMAASHGITTGARLDLYWTVGGVSGRRYGVVVGTVSVNSVPISGGAGDNLPAAASAITAQVPTSEAVALTGDNAVAIAVKLPVGGTAVFAKSDNTTIAAVQLSPTNTVYVWSSGDGGTNPLAGQTVAKVFLSQPSSAVGSTASGVVQFN